MNAKPWQIVVIVVGLLIGVAGIVYVARPADKVKIADTVHVVDVTTGEVFKADISGRRTVPTVNPETGKESLVRCYFDKADGKWKVGSRDMAIVRYLQSQNVAVEAVDLRTGEILADVKDVTPYRRKG